MLAGAFANLLLNSLIAVLLAVTIAYCWLLNRRIKILQDSRGELALLLKHFDDSTKRASDSIIALQATSKKIGDTVQLRIEKSNDLLDDLAYMIDKGEKIANKLEASFAVTRARNRVMAEQPQETVQKPVKPKVETIAMEPTPTLAGDKSVTQREKTVASLEAVLERVAGRVKSLDKEMEAESAPSPASIQRTPFPTRQRSKAEQELLDMIKTGIKG